MRILEEYREPAGVQDAAVDIRAAGQREALPQVIRDEIAVRVATGFGDRRVAHG